MVTVKVGAIRVVTDMVKATVDMAAVMITMVVQGAMTIMAVMVVIQVTPNIHTGIMVNTTTIRTTIHIIRVIIISNKITIKKNLYEKNKQKKTNKSIKSIVFWCCGRKKSN